MDEAAQTGYCRCQRGTGSKDGAEGYCVYEKVVDGVVSSEIVVANNCREAMYCLFICSGVKKKFFSDCMIIVSKNFFLLCSKLFSSKI